MIDGADRDDRERRDLDGEAVARDEAARRAAQSVFDRPLVLEAGAGTGKTSTLVARIVVWLVGAGWENAATRPREAPRSTPPTPSEIASDALDRLVAITFTEAAAAEMAERVGSALSMLAARAVPTGLDRASLALDDETIATRASALLGNLDRLTARTIHGFCAGILRRFPVEAGLAPEFVVDADGTLVEEAARETVEAAMRDALRGPEREAWLFVAERRVGAAEIDEALRQLLAAGVAADALDESTLMPAAYLDGIRERCAAAFVRLREAFGEEIHTLSGRARTIRADVELLEPIAEILDPRRGPAEFAPMLADAEQAGLAQLRKRTRDWSGGDFGRTVADHYQERTRTLTDAAREAFEALEPLLALDPEMVRALARILRPLLHDATERVQREGVVTFDTLLRGTRELLARDRRVLATLRREIDQLLVDEFQDTDATQCEIVRLLALEDVSSLSAPKPGLFLVGDPKQSIYGFRSADLAAYEAFVDEIVAAGGDRHHLVRNYRSVPGVIEEVERLVAPSMEEVPGLQPPFVGLVSTKAAEGDAPAVEHWTSWSLDETDDRNKERTRARAAARIEARAIARDVAARAAAGTLRFGDVAILMRSRGDQEIYLDALREAGVPFAVAKDRSYYQRREVVEMAAFVRAILDPADELALLTWLRSSLVGVPDAALPALWDHRLPGLLAALDGAHPERLRAALAAADAAARELASRDVRFPGRDRIGTWSATLSEGIRALDRLRSVRRTRPADEFVDALRELSFVEATEAARHLGAFRAANLARLFDALDEAFADPFADTARLLRALRRAVAEAREAEEATPPEYAADAVTVTTVHGAKGLGFDTVYLVQTHKRSGGGFRRATEIAWYEGDVVASLCRAPTAGWIEYQRHRARVAHHEAVRLLYVAATRAKSRLVVCGCDGAPSRGSERRFLEMIAQRRGETIDRHALCERARTAGVAHVDEDGARWAYPDLLARDDASAGEASHGAGDELDADALVDDARRLEEARADARLHEKRPFRAAASAHHDRDPERWLGRRDEEDDDASATPVEDVRLAAGTALHAILEKADLSRAADELRAWRDDPGRVADSIEGELSAEARDATLERVREILDEMLDGEIPARLERLAAHVLARELPLLAPPDPDAVNGPVGVVVGIADLVYRDPDTDAIVVADYKTDRAESADDVERARREHAAQGRAYVCAVASALALPEPPRFELWLLRGGTIVAIDEVSSC